MTDRLVEVMLWRNIALYAVSFAAGEIAGSIVRAYFPAPRVLIFTIAASASILGLGFLTGWVIVATPDARLRSMQRIVAAGFFIGFWLGYLV